MRCCGSGPRSAANCSLTGISGGQSWRRVEPRFDVRSEFLDRGTIVNRAIALERSLLGEPLGHEGRACHLTNRRAAIHPCVLRRLGGHVTTHRATRHRRFSGKRTAGRDGADRHSKRTQDRNEKPGHDLGLCHDDAESTRGNSGLILPAPIASSMSSHHSNRADHRCCHAPRLSAARRCRSVTAVEAMLIIKRTMLAPAGESAAKGKDARSTIRQRPDRLECCRAAQPDSALRSA